LGVIANIKLVDGNFQLEKGRKIKFLATKASSTPEEVGFTKIERVKTNELSTGEVGYIATGLKDIRAVKVGDTLMWEDNPASPLPGYKEIKPFVFVSIYPIENSKSSRLREALENYLSRMPLLFLSPRTIQRWDSALDADF